MSLNSNSFDTLEPIIRKAQFILPNQRIYTLDFDHNIQMQELKLMIQKAAHIRNRSFRIFSSGNEYTQYNKEIFSALFPNQKLVIFTLELNKNEEDYIDNELLLQMNCPCEAHSDKFLLYYCFTCNKSICCQCFTSGEHKNHLIQDKCFYLLSSKYLVEKIFENWSQKPYEDFKISVDLSDLKNKLNTVMFQELFNMLKKVQEKCNLLIDEYNNINITSLDNIRNSVRDIKLNCIKNLDYLKEDLNVKNIVNNEDVFIKFDQAYKNMGKIENDKFLKNLKDFEELNKKVSILVENLVRQVYSLIYKTLNDMLEDSQYENIKKQINLRFIKPSEQNDINKRISEHKKKRNSLGNINSINSTNFAKAIATSVQNRLNSAQAKEKNAILTNQEMKQINPFLSKKENMDIDTNNNKSNNNNNLINNNRTQLKINISKDESGNPFSSAQLNRTNLTANLVHKINISNSNLFSAVSNKDKTSFNQMNQNNSSSNNNVSNMNINMDNTSQISSMNMMNHTQPQVYTTIETKNVITPNIVSNITNNNQNLNNINSGDNNTHTHVHNGILISYNIPDNNNSNNNSEIIKYIESTQRMINNNQNNKEKEETTESENEIHTPLDVHKYLNSKYILAPIPQTNSIKVLTSNISEERTVPLKFPENFGSNIFFLDCAHCNSDFNKCLYVSGGIEYNSEKNRSNALLCIDISKSDDMKIKKLANMNIARCGHTMISDGKYLYAVGGENLNSVERYDIENDVWEILPSMICKRMYPILHINNGYLYAFFGKYSNGEYPCSIERLNLCCADTNIKRGWEMIIFSNPKNLDVNIYGSAVLEVNGMLYFFGGNVNEVSTNKIFFYNFERKIIEEEESEVMWKEYFRENKLHPIGERVVQCSDNKYFGVYITIQQEQE